MEYVVYGGDVTTLPERNDSGEEEDVTRYRRSEVLEYGSLELPSDVSEDAMLSAVQQEVGKDTTRSLIPEQA